MNQTQIEEAFDEAFVSRFGITPQQSAESNYWKHVLQFDVTDRDSYIGKIAEFAKRFDALPDVVILTRDDALNCVNLGGPPHLAGVHMVVADLPQSRLIKLVETEKPRIVPLSDFFKQVLTTRLSLSYDEAIEGTDNRSRIRWAVGPVLVNIQGTDRLPVGLEGSDTQFVKLNDMLFERVFDTERVKTIEERYSDPARRACKDAPLPPEVPTVAVPEGTSIFTKPASDTLPLVEWRMGDYLRGAPVFVSAQPAALQVVQDAPQAG